MMETATAPLQVIWQSRWGLPIGLFVTCVTNHGDTYDAVFGYTNDNRAEQIVPLGLSNTFAPAPGNARILD